MTQNRINNDYYALFIAKELVTEGYNVLLYDSRAHGISTGKHVTLGKNESQDILKIVAFANQQGFQSQNIGIIGSSLGAISVLLAAEDLQQVGALIVDSAAAEVTTVLENILQKERNIPEIFNPTVFFFLKTIYGIDLNKLRPIDHVRALPDRRFLFLHGEDDPSISVENSQMLFNVANTRSHLLTFPGAEHIATYKSDPERYMKEVLMFLSEELEK